MLTIEAAARKDKIGALGSLEHRHFATIAAILRNLPDYADKSAVIEHFADELIVTNPRFDRARFLAACR